MVWVIAGCGVALAVLAMAFIVRRRRLVARRGSSGDAAYVWLHGDPAAPPVDHDDPRAGGGPDTGSSGGDSDSGGSDSGSSDGGSGGSD